MVFDPVASLHRATVHTHYYPDAWRGNETSLDVLDEFTQLFQFRLVCSFEAWYYNSINLLTPAPS